MTINIDEVFAQSNAPVRQSRAEDAGFLERVFRSTRDDLLQLPLPASMLEPMLRQQYQLQQQAYRQQWPEARCWVVESMCLPVGKIHLAHKPEGVHLVDLAFLPEARGRGMGSGLLKILQTGAARHQLAISLSVDNRNGLARKLYQRLGFVVMDSSATHEFMRWSAS